MKSFLNKIFEVSVFYDTVVDTEVIWRSFKSHFELQLDSPSLSSIPKSILFPFMLMSNKHPKYDGKENPPPIRAICSKSNPVNEPGDWPDDLLPLIDIVPYFSARFIET